MMDIDEIDNSRPKKDFRRANGAPMIIDKEGKNQRFSRPSGWGKTLDDENALVNWKIDTAAKGVAQDSSLQAEWVACKDDDRETKARLREKAIQAGRGNQASDTGTALHAMSERWEDPDDDFDPPAKYRAALECYSAEMQRIGIVSELFEYTVVNLEYRAAGTCDRLYRLTRDLLAPDGTILPAGTRLIGDLKTGKKLDFSLPGYHVQMAIYALGEFYNVETDEFMPTPEINPNWGLLVHMPAEGDKAGTCEILWCDLQVGNYGAWLVHEIKDWRRKWKSGEYLAPIVEVGGFSNAGIVAAALDAEIVDADADEFVEVMLPFIRSRMAAIRQNSDALKALAFKWPDGVPSPKSITTASEVSAVLDLLDKIEADFGFPFLGDDPRVTPGAHLSAGPVSNTPRSGQKERSQ
jgi:hypothetical protein